MPRRQSRPEETLHRAVAAFLDVALPHQSVWFHVPNGGARSKAEAGIFKALGVRAGVPDILILYAGRAIFIELKAGKGRVTPKQAEMHQRLMLSGALVTVCRSVEEVEAFLKTIMPLRAAIGVAA